MDRTLVGIFSRLTTVLLVGAVAVAAFLSLGAIAAVGPTDVGVRAKIEPSELRSVEGEIEQADVVVRIDHADASQVRWSSARDLAPMLLFVGVLWLLRRLLRSAREGEVVWVIAEVFAAGVRMRVDLEGTV